MASAHLKSKMKDYMQSTEIIQELKKLLTDDTYRTVSGYSIDSETYPDNEIPFVEQHMSYLKKHPHIDPAHYLSNLRLMLKVR